MNPHVLTPRDITEKSPIGGKARALSRLSHGGFRIPEWVVVSPAAWIEWNQLPQQNRAVFEHHLAESILRALADVECFAVRSSASDEDGAEHSFAGQLQSFLFVPKELLIARIKSVWASGFSEQIAAYRKERGLGSATLAPAVLVQRMIDADSAGVAFGADPVSGQRGVAIVSSVWGLGTSLVGGDADADLFRIDRSGTIIERKVVEKKTAHRISYTVEEGIAPVPVESGQVRQPSLTDEQAVEVAKLVRRATHYFTRPQDIEWAVKDAQVYLLQSRPITSMQHMPDPDGCQILWDNSNIAESYGGVTTPLTFSFASRVYEEVYRQFCRLMGIRDDKINAHAVTFRRMLGLVKGRVYYNLLSWYSVLALLPGFQTNRRFMEQMMGVKETLPPQIVAEFDRKLSSAEKFQDRVDLVRCVIGLIRNHLSLAKQIRAFYERLNVALAEPKVPLVDQRMDELTAHYLDLEKQLLTRWDAPLVNDFLAMIFYGVLRKLCTKWCDDADGTLQNDLISAAGGIISAEPARRMKELAILAARDANFAELLTVGEPEAIQEAMAQQIEFGQKYRDYLKKFGDRCLEELKLETATLDDDPLMLLRSIGHSSKRVDGETKAAGGPSVEEQLREKAEARLRTRLRWDRRPLFFWVLRNARTRVRERENLRFERTRLFGRVRRIFVECGKRLFAMGRLDEPRDVFYLTVNEVLGFADGTTVSTDLRGLVTCRKEEFARYPREAPPADRFETTGAVHQGNSFSSKHAPAAKNTGDLVKGIGCCPGVVRGPARVILDPRNAEVKPGEILVAVRTDPGWIMLFPSASGLLVEYGSLLSHSAIVARELGLPAVVSITGLTAWVKTGEWVELNGRTGTVRKIAEAERE